MKKILPLVSTIAVLTITAQLCVAFSTTDEVVDQDQVEDRKNVNFIYLLEGSNKIGFIALQSASLMCSVIGKYVIIRVIYDSGDLLSRPINLALFIEATVSLSNNILQSCLFVIAASTKVPIVQTFGSQFCNAYLILTGFGFLYNITASLGMAIIRILYMKADHFVKVRIGELQLVLTVVTISILWTLIIYPYLWVATSIPKDSKDFISCFCYGSAENVPGSFFSTTFEEPKQVRRIVGLLSILQVVAEFVIYCFLFYFVYQHDKSMTYLIGNNTFRSRCKQNAIKMIEQFYLFILRFIISMAFSICLNMGVQRDFLIIAMVNQHAVTALVTICLSRKMRQEASRILSTITHINIDVLSFMN